MRYSSISLNCPTYNIVQSFKNWGRNSIRVIQISSWLLNLPLQGCSSLSSESELWPLGQKCLKTLLPSLLHTREVSSFPRNRAPTSGSLATGLSPKVPLPLSQHQGDQSHRGSYIQDAFHSWVGLGRLLFLETLCCKSRAVHIAPIHTRSTYWDGDCPFPVA